MATRGGQVFVTPQEFSAWLRKLIADLSIHVFTEQGPQEELRRWDGTESSLSKEIYLTTEAPESVANHKYFNIADIGWISVSVPRVVNNTLLLCQLGAKSDWWDPADRKTYENPESIRLFNRIWRRLKKQISFTVWAKNVVTGGEASYRDIGYTEGAKEWSRSGGKLMQEGAANIAYEIREVTSKNCSG